MRLVLFRRTLRTGGVAGTICIGAERGEGDGGSTKMPGIPVSIRDDRPFLSRVVD